MAPPAAAVAMYKAERQCRPMARATVMTVATTVKTMPSPSRVTPNITSVSAGERMPSSAASSGMSMATSLVK